MIEKRSVSAKTKVCTEGRVYYVPKVALTILGQDNWENSTVYKPLYKNMGDNQVNYDGIMCVRKVALVCTQGRRGSQKYVRKVALMCTQSRADAGIMYSKSRCLLKKWRKIDGLSAVFSLYPLSFKLSFNPKPLKEDPTFLDS